MIIPRNRSTPLPEVETPTPQPSEPAMASNTVAHDFEEPVEAEESDEEDV